MKPARRYCQSCSHYNDCGFVSRGLEHKCDKLDLVMIGYDYAMQDAIEWIHDHIQIDEPQIEYNEDGQPLAESFLAHAEARCIAADEVVRKFKQDFGL